MIYLLLSILFSSSLLIFFKLFERFKLNSILAIGVNYFAAACVGLIFIDWESARGDTGGINWVYISIFLGIMFTLIFNFSRFATQKIGMGITSVAMKLGVLFPVLIGVFYYQEAFSTLNYVGLLFGFMAIYFINKPSQSTDNLLNKSLLFLPLIVWIGSGICDSSVQFIQKQFPVPCTNGMFSFIAFLSAFISSLLFILYKKMAWDWRSVVGGICLGIPNYFSIYFLVHALKAMREEFQMTSANLFMVNNLTIVVCSIFLGIIFFKERLNRFNIFGICLSLVALIFISI
jgi:drug/metabolite transporter (DMT)-like permease